MKNTSEEMWVHENDEENESFDRYYELHDNISAQKENGLSGHTMRKDVSGPYPETLHHCDRVRSFHTRKRVRDNYHYPASRTWGCKGFQDKGGRQWLNRYRKYEKHCKRKMMKESIKSQSKPETEHDPV